jgi:hypothetical protein
MVALVWNTNEFKILQFPIYKQPTPTTFQALMHWSYIAQNHNVN